MNKEEIISILKSYFNDKARIYGIDMAFLYGSWAGGFPKIESDIDIAVVFNRDMDGDKIFKIITDISLELVDILKKETNVLYIDFDLSKPMLHYNAIVQGIPVFIRDFKSYVDIRFKAITQMEDFSIFGLRWQEEIARKRLEALSRA